jgi:hypothetical protein
MNASQQTAANDIRSESRNARDIRIKRGAPTGGSIILASVLPRERVISLFAVHRMQKRLTSTQLTFDPAVELFGRHSFDVSFCFLPSFLPFALSDVQFDVQFVDSE